MKSRIEPLAIAAIVLSSLGVLTLGILAIPGIICGHLARKRIEDEVTRSKSLATAALIVGYSVLSLYILLPILFFGGAGILVLIYQYPGFALGIIGMIILLISIPFIYAYACRCKDDLILREVIKQNQNR